jgi:mannose/cellobiose epimerase-like protein (N-acyl-D-glucosamine 2-epimerase family)
MPDYKDKNFLRNHAIDMLEWLKPICKDNEYGGFYCTIKDNGEIIDSTYKELVSTARWILNYSFGFVMSGNESYKDYVRHGLEFLEIAHRDHKNGGYHSVIIGNEPQIGIKSTYGAAFVFCAFCNTYKAGIKEIYPLISEMYDFMEKTVWEEKYGLYVDDIKNDYTKILPYKGQNSNMHMTEAMLAAFEATGDERYLNRAYTLANNVTRKLTKYSEGLIYEHYKNNWEIDYDYNKYADKYSISNLLRPYGFLPGHWAEWAKLLLLLERYRPEDWQLEVAEYLFNKTMEYSWDTKKGGISYSVSLDRTIIDPDNHYWAHIEIISAAASLALRTKNEYYWEIYNKIWEFSDKYFIDKKNGGPWHRIISGDKKQPLSDIKLVPFDTDYHVIGACHDIPNAMKYYEKDRNLFSQDQNK